MAKTTTAMVLGALVAVGCADMEWVEEDSAALMGPRAITVLSFVNEPNVATFEMLDVDHMNQVAAYCGFPQRYPHWRFGMEYERLQRSHRYGLGKIYEMVINNDPCYAYLLNDNAVVDQKTVMAHVYGHCDFFKNNFAFAHTNRKMMDKMANHGTRVRRYIDRYGI